jgi:spermidine synthase
MKISPLTRASFLAFLIAFTTLFAQILVHRIVSAKLLNNYAFFIISLCLLGFAISGIILSYGLKFFLSRQNDFMAICASLFAITMIGASIIFYRIDVGDQLSPLYMIDLVNWIPIALLFTVPFIFCGLMLGALLSASCYATTRIYCFDLLGSALGAAAVIIAIRWLGVELSMLLACACLLFGTVMLSLPIRRFAMVTSGLSLALLTIAFLLDNSLFAMKYPQKSMLADTQKSGEAFGIEYIIWDPLSRIEVSRIPPVSFKNFFYKSLIGTNPSLHQKFKRMITQNNFAFTYALEYNGNPSSLKGIEETIYASAYVAMSSVARPKVATIGVGGGFDILTAIYFNASEVTGIEINSATCDILTKTYADYFRHWVKDPRVHLVNEEGRYYLATTDKKYDVIQLSGVDSYSGTPGAAHVFSESYLYTEDAMQLYLSKLTDNGILNIMRLEHDYPREMLRVLTTAISSLRKMGISNPSAHIVMVSQQPNNFTALLLKKTPFSAKEMEAVELWAASFPYLTVSAAPNLNAAENAYQIILSLNNQEKEKAVIANYLYDISPVGDNRPFFFRFSFWKHLFLPHGSPLSEQVAVPVLEYSILFLLGITGVVAILCVILPLFLSSAAGLHNKHAGRYGLFCASLGIGYMAIEISLLQKFGLFLGHPNYSLSVVLASLLVATGAGSLFAEFVVAKRKKMYVTVVALTLVILVEYSLIFPLLPQMVSFPFFLKISLVFLLVAPVGFCLGTFFPTVLEQLKTNAPNFVPWAWGLNGIFSVIGPIAGVALSTTWGINVLLLSAIPIYFFAAWALPSLTHCKPTNPRISV